MEDPKEAYSSEQLSEIGACTIYWNHVDAFVDWLLIMALRLDTITAWEVTTRISGSDAKLEILHACADRSRLLSDDARNAINTTLSAVAEYKKFRDNLVHSVPYNINLGIAHRVTRKAKLIQSLVTVEALSGLYSRIKFLLNELREVDLLYRLADEKGAKKVYQGRGFDPLERRRTQDVPAQTARLRKVQQDRLSLPPLPEFPDEHEGWQDLGESESHPDSEGRPK